MNNYRTVWLDKYTTSVYSPHENISCRRYELQPIPVYIRWAKTNELHCLRYEQRVSLQKDSWDDTPQFLLPSHVLDLVFQVIPDPLADLFKYIVFLAWVNEDEVREYHLKHTKNLESTLKSDAAREQWRGHPLYSKTKHELELMSGFKNTSKFSTSQV